MIKRNKYIIYNNLVDKREKINQGYINISIIIDINIILIIIRNKLEHYH